MTTDVSPDLSLKAIGSDARTIDEWLINFQALMVVLDPFTYESSWIIDTSVRIMNNFASASIRVSWVVTATEDQAKEFLGPFADQFLTYVDPDRSLVRALALEELPAFVHMRQDRTIGGMAQGWDPDGWRAVAEGAAENRSWLRPIIPATGDPSPFPGSPALG